MKKLLGLACLTLVAACPPRDDDYTPQIRVAPGAGERMNLFPGKSQAPPDAGAAGPSARVHVMTSGDVLGGPNAIGRAGDILLENDEVAFVIDQIGSSPGFAQSGGNLVDAADAHERKDELGQLFTYFGTFPRQGVYETIETGTGGGTAWVLAKGHELYEHKLAVQTRYELHGGDRAMLVTTTLTNEGDAAIGGLTPGDAIQWGGAEKFSPDRGKGFKGPSSGAFLGGVGRFVSYAIAGTDGDIDAINGPSWSDTIQGRSITVAPGKSMKYARIFLVGARADTAGVVTELSRAAGDAVGAVSIALTDSAGGAVRVPEGGTVEVSNAAGNVVMDIRALHEGERLEAELPPGHYGLAYVGGGGRTGSNKAAIDVVREKTVETKLAVTVSGKMTLQCSEGSAPSPCKATFEGVGQTRTPEFGPPHAAGAARNQFTSSDGAIAVDLAPGRYRVTLSRGPEVALTQFEKDVAPGTVTDGCAGDKCRLTRVVDTTGYVATDFHQHTVLGIDAPTATRDRVISNAAEGVEVAVASEHNVIADLEPIVKDLGLASRLVSISGNELTTDASRKPWGHANVWPLTYDPGKPRGGAMDVRDKSAHELFEEIRKTTPVPFVLQINHPRAGSIGYFDLYGFDRATGLGTDPAYDPGFDALEIWNGRNVHSRSTVQADLLALLRTGHPVTALADTDTHGVVMQEPGYPRTYVRVSDDAHLDAWDASRTTDLVKAVKERRDVVLTNGPFLQVKANGAGIGGIARASGGSVLVSIEVTCAPWIKVDKLRVQRARATTVVEQAVTLAPGPKGALVGKAQVRLPVDKDDAFFVEVMGHDPMSPVLGRDSGTADPEIAPFAMTGAIWIDGDGDGKSLGR